MNKDNENIEVAEVVEDGAVVKLSKEYDFEGKKISELDLSGLEGLTIQDLEDLTETAKKRNPKISIALPELSLTFAVCAAQRVSGLPFDFFNLLSMSEGLKLKNKVADFLY